MNDEDPSLTPETWRGRCQREALSGNEFGIQFAIPHPNGGPIQHVKIKKELQMERGCLIRAVGYPVMEECLRQEALVHPLIVDL